MANLAKQARLTGSFAATGQSGSAALHRDFNLSLSGTWVGGVTLQRSFDDGATWLDCEAFTANVEKRGQEIEMGVLYRFNCTAFTSGAIAYRLGA